MKNIVIKENGFNVVFEINKEQVVRLLHFSCLEFDERRIRSNFGSLPFTPVELMISGQDKDGERHGSKYVRTSPGCKMKYKNLKDYRNKDGRKLELVTYDLETNIEVVSHYQFFDDVQVVRAWTHVENKGEKNLGIEYISSFAITGIEKEGLKQPEDKLELRIPHNGWQKELHWNTYKLSELGMSSNQEIETRRSSKTIGIGNVGNWSTKEYLPMGYLENTECGSSIYWQIEHNGSWYWEISDQDGHLYLKLSGPTEHQSHWWKCLKPADAFTSVPVSFGSSIGGFDYAMGELTKYRRRIRRKNEDNEKLPVIFNDYMNCLFGDPTTDKEIPLIDAAARAGCEYYCIDCGWYSDGDWWNGVGEWLPSEKRFPNGIEKLIKYIRDKKMIPGLWLELEVMGNKCSKAQKVPDNWFFVRHGLKVQDRSRYQLDFRNPEVIAYANEVMKRLIEGYKVGYIKMDYNIEPGIGTEIDADSFGDGLLEHQRAYLGWIDELFLRYPDLIIENCSSGGLRMDYAMLQRHSIQSTSDQENFINYATISANAPTAVTPEQAAVWSYPQISGTDEEVIFNMINASMLRIHQSGHLAEISPQHFALVKEAIDYYKSIRSDLKSALPYWPLGFSEFGDSWVSLGLKVENREYLAVWRRNSKSSFVTLPVKHLKGKSIEIICGYPKNKRSRWMWNREVGELTVELPVDVSARLFQLTYL